MLIRRAGITQSKREIITQCFRGQYDIYCTGVQSELFETASEIQKSPLKETKYKTHEVTKHET